MPHIIRNLKAPRRSIYKVGEVLRRPLPIWLAKLLALGNHPPHSLLLATYDGSGQACHPSVAVFGESLYMACTPYPYGEEFYENPCVYIRDENHWKPVLGAFPIACPEKLGVEHYSDPCLFVWDGQLALLYRKCERHSEGKVDQLYIASTGNGTIWTPPRLLVEGCGDSLISPAPGRDGKELFCVEYDGDVDSRLVRYGLGTGGFGKKTVCRLSGLDPRFFVWHIDVLPEPDGDVRGLFMLRERRSDIASVLALFRFLPETDTWLWERDLTLEAGRDIRYLYKSAFLGRADRLLCSACDRSGRYFLFEKQLQEGGRL